MLTEFHRITKKQIQTTNLYCSRRSKAQIQWTVMTIPLISPQGFDYSYVVRTIPPSPPEKQYHRWMASFRRGHRHTIQQTRCHHKEQGFQVEDVIHRWLLSFDSPCKWSRLKECGRPAKNSFWITLPNLIFFFSISFFLFENVVLFPF
jgi:hypothetical protein